MKKTNNNFTALKYKIAELKEDESDLSGSGGESKADLFFLLNDNYQGLEPKENTAEHTLIYNDKKKIYIQKKDIPEDSGPT